MDNETGIPEETVPKPTEISEPASDVPTQTKPKSKKGIMIGIAAIAIVAILLISFMLMSGTGVKGKWMMEKIESFNPDGTVNQSYPAPSGDWWEFNSDGTLIQGNESGVYDYGLSTIDYTWEYVNESEIKVKMDLYFHYPDLVTDPDTNETYWINRTGTEVHYGFYTYSIDGDSLTLDILNSDREVIVRTYYTKAEG